MLSRATPVPPGEWTTTTPTPAAPPRLGIGARLIRRAILVYQWLFSWRASPCRYVPTCSTYALEAVEVHGAVRGTWLAVRRLSRCHPWGGHGHDPVPERKQPR